jgi:Prolipoprotein diacylglyceryl transferase
VLVSLRHRRVTSTVVAARSRTAHDKTDAARVVVTRLRRDRGHHRSVTLNAWFDRIPRIWFDVGVRRVPAFRSIGIIGFHVALGVAIAASLWSGVPLASALGLSAVAALSFFGWGMLRRALTGRESLVLLEYVWAAYGAVAVFAWASSTAMSSTLDVFSVSVPWFLAFGRLGCTTVGCCHGSPATVGLRYGPAHPLPARLVGRRLFPVQLIEALALCVIGTVGMALITRTSGTATVWFLAMYSVIRFGCERLRGDRRPSVKGIPVAQTMCLAQLGASIAASEVWLVAGSPGRETVVALGVLGATVTAGGLLLVSRGRNPLVAQAHLDEVWEKIWTAPCASTSPPTTVATTAAMTMAVTRCRGGRHVSLSHPFHEVLGVALAMGGEGATSARGITHFILRDQSTEQVGERVANIEAMNDREIMQPDKAFGIHEWRSENQVDGARSQESFRLDYFRPTGSSHQI